MEVRSIRPWRRVTRPGHQRRSCRFRLASSRDRVKTMSARATKSKATRSALGSVGLLSAGTALLAAALAAPVTGQATERVSVDSAGAQGNNGSGEPSISADGRYVAFVSI